jgi:hypothetical protein
MEPKKNPRVFRKIMTDLPGLRINVEKLFVHKRDCMLVVSRLTGLHLSQSPFQNLDKQTVHDKFLELMQNCHNERDLMWMRSRMGAQFWQHVRSDTSWTRDLDFEVVRTLALGLTQAAWDYYKNPKRKRSGERKPCSKFAIAALRFANDIKVYESHLPHRDEPMDTDFSEWRGPVHHDNGEQALNPKGKPCAQPAFPVSGYSIAVGPLPRGTVSEAYSVSEKDPEFFKDLKVI